MKNRKRGDSVATAPERVVVVQTKRGLAQPEDRVPVTHIDVPDLWHSCEALERIAAEIRRDNPTDNVVVEARARTLDFVGEKVKKGWDIACDMKRCLQETINPSVTEALSVLEGLKAEAEVRKLAPEDIQWAIKALSRALEDGQR